MDTPLLLKNIEIIQNICLRGSRCLDFGGKGYKIFGLDGRTFDRRWISLYRDFLFLYRDFLFLYFHDNFWL